MTTYAELPRELCEEIWARLDEASATSMAFVDRSSYAALSPRIAKVEDFTRTVCRSGTVAQLMWVRELFPTELSAFSLWCAREALLGERDEVLAYLATLDHAFFARSSYKTRDDLFVDIGNPWWCVGALGKVDCMQRWTPLLPPLQENYPSLWAVLRARKKTFSAFDSKSSPWE